MPVTIVEFSDFQCPYCQRAQDAIKEALAKFDGKVKLSFRDFPLRDLHANAQGAAEAARCAGEQGKFWEYHNVLFANQGKLDHDNLLKHARTLQLDETQFAACLESGKYKAEVERDIQDGMRAGVSRTPGFFVNGILLSGAQPLSAFEKAIQAELATRSEQRVAQ